MRWAKPARDVAAGALCLKRPAFLSVVLKESRLLILAMLTRRQFSTGSSGISCANKLDQKVTGDNWLKEIGHSVRIGLVGITPDVCLDCYVGNWWILHGWTRLSPNETSAISC
jgi:hypothetical protein